MPDNHQSPFFQPEDDRESEKRTVARKTTEPEARDYRPVRQRRDGRLGCLGGIMYTVFVISVSVILACLAWLTASDLLALNKEETVAVITLPPSIFSEKEVVEEDEDGKVIGKKTVEVADIDYVAAALKDGGIIEYEFLFKLYSSFSDADQKLDPGTYELSTAFDYRALVKKMQTGSDSQVETEITFPEGFTIEQIFARLEANGVCSKEDLYAAAAEYNYSYSFLEGIETGDPLRLEGFLFPDTYKFFQGMQASSAINKFLSNFHYKLTADMLSALANRGLTFSEFVNIASMIEKEAADDSERAIIASVIYNRLAINMGLGIDATLHYIFPEHEGYLTAEQLLTDSPYNTRMYTGLPPTAICNPGLASLNAALWPAATDYYYYTLNTETGKHEFFQTKDEHDEFVATQNY